MSDQPESVVQSESEQAAAPSSGSDMTASGDTGARVSETELDAVADSDTVGEADAAHEYAEAGHSDGDDADDGDDDTDDTAASRRGSRAPRVADLEREGEVAADFLETLLDIADLDGDIDVDVDGDRAAVAIVDSDEGRVPRRLVGPDGKVLDALQELTRLAVQAATGERSRLMLDVAGHRAERRAALVQVAQRAIADVKASGQKTSLEPMSAFERKVVHDEVLAAGLVSQSDGVEPNRFVVVLPA
jgi:spoIIIJ-associated protein